MLLRLTVDDYILARNRLIELDLIAFDGQLFQVLSLPETLPVDAARPLTTPEDMHERDPATIQPALRELPVTLPDIRHAGSFLVHKDFGIRFDANVYTVPPWAINKKVTVKADAYTVTIFHKDTVIARHTRHYEKKQRIELPQHREQVRKLHHNQRGSTMITTNRLIAEWNEIFYSTVTASAIADRLTSDVQPVILEGTSYRRKPRKKK